MAEEPNKSVEISTLKIGDYFIIEGDTELYELVRLDLQYGHVHSQAVEWDGEHAAPINYVDSNTMVRIVKEENES